MTDTDFPTYVPDKDELRTRLSLDYVCSREGIRLDRNGEALCPFHEDRDPSFHLYDGDDGITRWHCYPCQDGGDVFDLLKRVHGFTFPEALRHAAFLLAELPPDYQPPKRSLPARSDPASWYAEVSEARTRAAEPANDGRLSAITGFVSRADSLQLAHEWDLFLRTTYGWGLGAHGSIYLPHWAPDGTLTGCKVRHADGKSSLPGSKYLHLYGSWLGRRHRAVILTEGETDMVWAAFTAAKEAIPIDVFALPSGASADIPPTYLDFLKGSKVVYLAFDPDEQGVEATRRWVSALNDAGFADVRVCCLPYKRDMREARPSLSTLLQEAKKPLPLDGINLQPSPAGFLRSDQDGNLSAVTSWTVFPIAQLSGDGEAGFDAYLDTRGTRRRVVIRLADLASAQSLNKWANQHEEIFTGSDAVRRDMAEYLKAVGSITPEIFQTAQVGLHVPPERYHFAGPSIVLTPEARDDPDTADPDADGYIGKLPWRYAPSHKAANVTGRLYLPYRHSATDDERRWRWSLFEDFLSLSSPDVIHPLLAWLVAAARRHEVREFPLLFLGGSSGVGKSTLARLAIRLLGSNIELDLGAITPFILSRTLAATTTLPVFVDEWTRLSRQDTREAFQGIVPLLYTGGMAERGQADLSVQVYHMTAPTIVAGEDTFALDRELERTVFITPSRAAQNPIARAALQDRALEGFGHYLHQFICDTASLPLFPSSASDRVEYNRQILLTGWRTLREYLDFMGDHYGSVPHLPADPDLSCFERDPTDDNENVYVEALRTGLEMRDPNGAALVWADPAGRGTWVRPGKLLGQIQRQGIDIQLPGRSRAMLSYFRERHQVTKDNHVAVPEAFVHVSAHLIHGLILNGTEVAPFVTEG